MAEVNISPGSDPFLSSVINELASMDLLQRLYALGLLYPDISTEGRSVVFTQPFSLSQRPINHSFV